MDSAIANVFKAMLQIGMVFVNMVVWLTTRLSISGNTRRVKASPKATKESERMAGCRDVVLQFASVYGHIARECMSREELEAKIDSGIAPQELRAELFKRGGDGAPSLGSALVEKGEPRKSGSAVTTVVQTCLNGQRSPHDEDPPAWMGLGWNNAEHEPALVSLAVGNEERARRAADPDRMCCSPQARQRGMARSGAVVAAGRFRSRGGISGRPRAAPTVAACHAPHRDGHEV